MAGVHGFMNTALDSRIWDDLSEDYPVGPFAFGEM